MDTLKPKFTITYSFKQLKTWGGPDTVMPAFSDCEMEVHDEGPDGFNGPYMYITITHDKRMLVEENGSWYWTKPTRKLFQDDTINHIYDISSVCDIHITYEPQLIELSHDKVAEFDRSVKESADDEPMFRKMYLSDLIGSGTYLDILKERIHLDYNCQHDVLFYTNTNLIVVMQTDDMGYKTYVIWYITGGFAEEQYSNSDLEIVLKYV